MALLDPTTVIEATIIAAADQQRIINSFHYMLADNSDPTTPTWTLDQFALSFRTRFRATILPMLHNSYGVRDYTFRTYRTWAFQAPPLPPKAPVILDTSVAIADPALDIGGAAGPALPTYAAVSVRKRVAVLTKNYRGGSRFSPTLEGDTDFNRLTPVALTAWQGAMSGFRPSLNAVAPLPPDGNPAVFVVFSKKLWYAAALPPASVRQFCQPVTNYIVNELLGSQVSRKRRPFGA